MAVTIPSYQPKNELIVCKGVGFDKTRQHVRLFPDADTQLAYFRGKAVYTTNTMEPIRVNKNEVFIEGNPETYADCDYIVFRNSDFNSRWYFAFIESPGEWGNTEMTRLNFTIDPFQTYFFDAVIPPCYVERRHWATDNIGDNLVPDNVELGDYIVNDEDRTGFFNTYSIVVACTTTKAGTPAPGGYYGGIYSGLNLLEFTSVTELNDFLTMMVDGNKGAAIQSIFMMPREFIKEKSTNITSEPVVKAYIYDAPKRNTVDGYTPKNKKLLTYPYKFLQCSNLSGASAEYAYEFFSTPGATFNVIGDYSPNPTIKMTPVGYNGFEDSSNAYDYGLTLNGFPQCAWSTDAYLAWLAQSGSVSALGMTFTGQDLAFAQQGLGAVGSLLSGNILGAASSFLGIAQNVAQVNAKKALPPQAHGQTANGAMVAFKAKDFFFTDVSIRAEFARIIDGYWTKYGYPCHELQSLVYKSRPYWNFIKTQGCLCTGDIPGWAKEELQDLFNNGVTIWHTDNIGNYYLDNSPT